jgi:hypothetical protein
LVFFVPEPGFALRTSVPTSLFRYREAILENLDTAMRVLLEAMASFKLRLGE